jgi:hypothetical protein
LQQGSVSKKKINFVGPISEPDLRAAATEDGLVNAWTNRMAGCRPSSIEARYNTLNVVRYFIFPAVCFQKQGKKYFMSPCSFSVCQYKVKIVFCVS